MPGSELRAWHVTGEARLSGPGGHLAVDVALRVDPAGRARIDIALPTGMSAAVVWIDGNRWILLDPTAARVWTGSAAEVLQIITQLPAVYQASLAFGISLVFLNEGSEFGRIWGLLPSPEGAENKAIPGRGPYLERSTEGGVIRLAEDAAWSVKYSGEPAGSAPWPQSWTVSRSPVTLEVTWLRFQELDEQASQLLRPRVPASFSAQPLASLLDAVVAPANRKPANP